MLSSATPRQLSVEDENILDEQENEREISSGRRRVELKLHPYTFFFREGAGRSGDAGKLRESRSRKHKGAPSFPGQVQITSFWGLSNLSEGWSPPWAKGHSAYPQENRKASRCEGLPPPSPPLRGSLPDQVRRQWPGNIRFETRPLDPRNPVNSRTRNSDNSKYVIV